MGSEKGESENAPYQSYETLGVFEILANKKEIASIDKSALSPTGTPWAMRRFRPYIFLEIRGLHVPYLTVRMPETPEHCL